MAVTENDVRTLMKEAGIKASVVDALKNNVSLVAQGLDSLDMPIIAAEIEARYGRDLSTAASTELKTIDAIVTLLNQPKA